MIDLWFYCLLSNTVSMKAFTTFKHAQSKDAKSIYVENYRMTITFILFWYFSTYILYLPVITWKTNACLSKPYLK